MPWTLPTSSHSWLDWPTSGGRFHIISLDLASLTSYQPMVEFSGHYKKFHISKQLTFLVKFANFWRWFSQTESRSDLPNLLGRFPPCQNTATTYIGAFLPFIKFMTSWYIEVINNSTLVKNSQCHSKNFGPTSHLWAN